MLRHDQNIIAGLIVPGSRVIDIGCGGGELLAHLAAEKKVKGYGLEIEPERVSAAVRRGLSAIQGDADADLPYYPDKGFDYAILGLTLQIMRHPREVLEQALRIASRVIVVIPNFGHIGNRLRFLLRGRMPVTSALPCQWYETPNIHFCTIRDFAALAEELGCKIETSLAIYCSGAAHPFSGGGSFGANMFGAQGLFVLSRECSLPSPHHQIGEPANGRGHGDAEQPV